MSRLGAVSTSQSEKIPLLWSRGSSWLLLFGLFEGNFFEMTIKDYNYLVATCVRRSAQSLHARRKPSAPEPRAG